METRLLVLEGLESLVDLVALLGLWACLASGTRSFINRAVDVPGHYILSSKFLFVVFCGLILVKK